MNPSVLETKRFKAGIILLEVDVLKTGKRAIASARREYDNFECTELQATDLQVLNDLKTLAAKWCGKYGYKVDFK